MKEALPMRARGPHSPTSCWLAGRTVSPEGMAATSKQEPPVSPSRREGRGRLLLQGKKRFSPVFFLSRRTQEIKSPRTANQQLILAEIPRGPELLRDDSCRT